MIEGTPLTYPQPIQPKTPTGGKEQILEKEKGKEHHVELAEASTKTPQAEQLPMIPPTDPEPDQEGTQHILSYPDDDGFMKPKKNVPVSILEKYKGMGLKTHPLFPQHLYENMSILSKYPNMGLKSHYDFFTSYGVTL